MRLPTMTCVSRRVRMLAMACVLALTGALAQVPLGTTGEAFAAEPEVPGWYMLMNDYYDGTTGHGDGRRRCLSTNAQTSTSGSGTHMVYLAECNAATPGQWWRVGDLDPFVPVSLRNYQDYNNYETWCLSANWTTPPGGGSGTHGAYTARCNADTAGQGWSVNGWDTVNNRWRITNAVYDPTTWESYDLSASHNNPYPDGGTYRVYTSRYNSSTLQQVWRLYQPAGRPNCTPCG